METEERLRAVGEEEVWFGSMSREYLVAREKGLERSTSKCGSLILYISSQSSGRLVRSFQDSLCLQERRGSLDLAQSGSSPFFLFPLPLPARARYAVGVLLLADTATEDKILRSSLGLSCALPTAKVSSSSCVAQLASLTRYLQS